MQIDVARELKAELLNSAAQERVSLAVPRGVASVGISVRPTGPGEPPRYGVAVRYSGQRGHALLDRAREIADTSAGAEVDVRDVGRIRALATPNTALHSSPYSPAALQQRVRPLRPGLSIAQHEVTAGTLGAFVTVTGSDGIYVLSNNHVLADAGRAALDDPVLQPGPADGGDAGDRIGRLARAVAFEPGGNNTVDAALALLEEVDSIQDVDPSYPAGRLAGWAEADDGVVVEKVGRTTGYTRGRVTAIELDDVAVEYVVGTVSFDGQIEVSGIDSAFSAGGDSGSLVYRPDTRQAIGLLFAGSERGGPDGAGLTFCNPIGLVLEALGATLVT